MVLKLKKSIKKIDFIFFYLNWLKDELIIIISLNGANKFYY